MSFTLSNLAHCVYYHRKQSGLTRIELAKLAGTGKSAIFNLEHGKETIQLDTLLKILHALNISLSLHSPLMSLFEEQKNAAG